MWRIAFLTVLLSLVIPLDSARSSERVWSAESEAERATARELYRRAIRLDRIGDYRAALDTLRVYREYAQEAELPALNRWEGDLRRSLGLSDSPVKEPDSEPRSPDTGVRTQEASEDSVVFAAPAAIEISFGSDEDDAEEEERDSYEERESHADDRDSYADDRDSYTDDRDSYTDERDSYTDDRDSYTDERDSYTDERDSYAEPEPDGAAELYAEPTTNSRGPREKRSRRLELDLPDTSRSALRSSGGAALAPNPAGPVLIVSGTTMAAGFGVVSGVTWAQGRDARGAGDQSGYETVRPANNTAFALAAVGGALVMGGITAAIADQLRKKRRANQKLAELR